MQTVVKNTKKRLLSHTSWQLQNKNNTWYTCIFNRYVYMTQHCHLMFQQRVNTDTLPKKVYDWPNPLQELSSCLFLCDICQSYCQLLCIMLHIKNITENNTNTVLASNVTIFLLQKPMKNWWERISILIILKTHKKIRYE